MPAELQIHPRSGRIHTSNQPTFVQDESGDVILDACRFIDGSAKYLHLAWPVPGSYASGNGTLKFRWRTGATGAGNNAYVGAEYHSIANGGATDTGSSIAEAAFTADATTNEITESTLSSAMTVQARSLVVMRFKREGANGSDTLSDNFDLDLLSFSVTSNPDFTKGSVWCAARSLIPGGGASRGNGSSMGSGGIIFPGAVVLPDAATTYAEVSFVIPPNYGGGNLAVYPYVVMNTTGSSQQCVFRLDHVAVQTGESWDQALTSGTQYTRTGIGFQVLAIGTSASTVSAISVPGPFASGDRVTLRFNRLGSDASDTSTLGVALLGLLVEYEVINKNPQMIYFDPVSGALPVASTAEVNVVTGTNQSLPVALMPDGEDHTLSLRSKLPSSWDTPNVLDIDWVSEGTGNWYMGLEYSSPAAGSDPDPAVTTVANAAKASAGAGVITRTSFTVETNLTDDDHINLNIVHEGTNVGHTCGYVRIIGARMRHSVEDPA